MHYPPTYSQFKCMYSVHVFRQPDSYAHEFYFQYQFRYPILYFPSVHCAMVLHKYCRVFTPLGVRGKICTKKQKGDTSLVVRLSLCCLFHCLCLLLARSILFLSLCHPFHPVALAILKGERNNTLRHVNTCITCHHLAQSHFGDLV